MRKLSWWSAAMSIFCSIALTGSVYETANHPTVWAGAGNPEFVERQLSSLAVQLGGRNTSPAVPAAMARRVADAGATASQERLDPITNWVLAKGKASIMTSQLAQLLGLSNGENVPVTQEGYRSPDGTIHIFAVSTATGHNEIIMGHRTAERIITWRMATSGQAIVTVYGNLHGDASVVPNDDYAQLLAGEIAYWEAKLPK